MLNSTYSTSPTITLNVSALVDSAQQSAEQGYLWQFSNFYRPIHGWLSTGVCLFGIPSNLLNIIVLTRPNMISSPTNLILTGLAFSDLLTMLSSLPFSIYFYVIHSNDSNEPNPNRDTFLWTHFAKLHVMASVTFHSFSIWLTVYLACYRYIYLVSSTPVSISRSSKKDKNKTSKHSIKKSNSELPIRNVSSSSNSRSTFKFVLQRFLARCSSYNGTLIGILITCIFCILFCFPAYLYPKVREKIINDTSNNYLSYNNSISFNKSYDGFSINDFNFPAITQPINQNSKKQQYVYYVDQSELDKATNGLIFKIMFYSQAILGKFMPCLLLVTFSSLLIHSLVIINRNNKKLNKSHFHKSKGELNQKKILENKKKISITNCLNTLVVCNGTNKNENLTVLIKDSNQVNNSIETIDLIKVKNEKMEEPTLNRRSSSSSELNNTKKNLKVKSNNHNHKVEEDEEEDIEISGAEPSNINLPLPAAGAKSPNLKMNQLGAKFQKTNNNSKSKQPKRNRVKENLRTTLMLIIVCGLFLLTEFPQSILLFFSIVIGNTFYQNVYMPLGDLLDIIALINNSINFLLYCTMSRQFRETFYKLVISLWCFNTKCANKKTNIKQNLKNDHNKTKATPINSNIVNKKILDSKPTKQTSLYPQILLYEINEEKSTILPQSSYLPPIIENQQSDLTNTQKES